MDHTKPHVQCCPPVSGQYVKKGVPLTLIMGVDANFGVKIALKSSFSVIIYLTVLFILGKIGGAQRARHLSRSSPVPPGEM